MNAIPFAAGPAIDVRAAWHAAMGVVRTAAGAVLFAAAVFAVIGLPGVLD